MWTSLLARSIAPWVQNAVLFSLAAFASLPGCDDGVSRDRATPAPQPLTYAAIQPVVQRSCLPCDHVGGIGPMPLESYADMQGSLLSVA